ncbi:GNAT family N-acetyltransferase [Niveibacterium sp. SC-1]|uniref:GNAT family N-acetyltransferase n=1 Tax=Niveibacterium sp. SC-1 TaxID=3135646 RepID=UPI00311DD074
MSAPHRLVTERLILRPWEEADREPLALLNGDPEVMACYPAPLTRAESDAAFARWTAHIAEHGWGFWAVERREQGAECGRCIGMLGLQHVGADLPCAPAVEIGWRLARDCWGQGYAQEGARAALAFAFGTLGLAEVVSFTALPNVRSRAVMERLGMLREAQDFEHPRVAPGHRLRLHCLFRMSAERARALGLGGG